jgi:hypothetical protein
LIIWRTQFVPWCRSPLMVTKMVGGAGKCPVHMHEQNAVATTTTRRGVGAMMVCVVTRLPPH